MDRNDVDATLELAKRHLNPTLPNLLRFMGFGVPLASAEGAVLRDVTGEEWLDFLGGLGVFNVGHRHPRVIAAVREQIERLPLNVPVFPNSLAARLAAELAEITPGRLPYTFFCSTGTEAVEAALKLARVATGRTEIVSAHGAFHGKTFGALSASGRDLYKAPFEPLVPDFRQLPYGDVDALAAAVSSRTAAVILEPVQGEAGVVLPPDDYLPAAREICTRHGALLILDEVQTGLGRTGRMFAAEHWGVAPDLLCLAKALGGGVLPLGAVCGTEAVWQALARNPWLHTSTFGSPGGNPLACAAGLATLAVLREEDLPSRAAELGAYFLARLATVRDEFPAVLTDIRGIGLLIGVEFADEEIAALTIAGMARRRVVAAYYLSNPRVFRFEPPLVVTREQIDRALTAFRDAIGEALALAEAAKEDEECPSIASDRSAR